MGSYNLENIKEMAEGDQDFVKVVVQTFLEEIPPDLKAMNSAIEDENASLAYQYAHKMKPNFQMFGLALMPQVEIIEDWSKSEVSKGEVTTAATIITNKVTAAEIELKNDFNF